VLIVALTGCASSYVRLAARERPGMVAQVGEQLIPVPRRPAGYYAGTALGAVCVLSGYLPALPLCLLDLPLSAALDTVLLPYDYLEHRRYRRELAVERARWNEARRRMPPISVWRPEPSPSGAAGAADVLAGLGIDRDYVTLVDEVRHPDD
jgi:uncharacterized protein YceK